MTSRPSQGEGFRALQASGAGEALAVQASEVARALSAPGAQADQSPKFAWSATNLVRLEMSTMGLRDFSRAPEGVPTLVCAPFALHGATIADLAPGHSLVDALARNGGRRLFVTDWRPASADMRLLTIDSYLADLNVAVDSAAAHSLPLSVFDELVRLGDGRVLGRRAIDLWEPALQANDALAALQIQPCEEAGKERLLERFRAWSDSTVDLPGAFFHQVVLWLFKENRLAQGRFTALGRQIDLADVRHPLFLLAAEGDAVVPPGQLLAVRRLVGTSPADIQSTIEPGGHLGLFIGADTLQGVWVRIARWLAQSHERELGAGRINATPAHGSSAGTGYS